MFFFINQTVVYLQHKQTKKNNQQKLNNMKTIEQKKEYAKCLFDRKIEECNCDNESWDDLVSFVYGENYEHHEVWQMWNGECREPEIDWEIYRDDAITEVDRFLESRTNMIFDIDELILKIEALN